ncbi:uncharacterized protein LOC107640195 [Arachis ipaensis]|uniref:uncharacterized protein LOC107640195 n=1 Tax=Arachis ipaensis TaxID=130454 RepID=UPI0007AF09B0|nr:uncharacterized protein LOC107640195 [Arachis ipaensis]XP_025651948.1 uncharacterized protein LOC112747954 [Arachis hypogaea]
MPRKPRYTVSNASGTVAGPNSQTHATPQTDGMHDTGADTSSAQRRARAPPPPRSGNGVDDHSEDEDYDSEADEIESFDDHLDNIFAAHEVERQGNANSKKKDTDYWVVDVIENGVISSMELTVKEVLALPPGKKIVLHHNRELQQVGQAVGLLSGFLGTLGSDFQQLPICAKSWKTMSKASKEHAYDQIKRVFHYEDDKRGWIKREILQRIGSCWRNSRNHLFHKVYDEELTFEQNIKRKPVGIEANHWKKFLQYRLDEDTKEQRQGRPIGRGKGWTMSHKKKNGKYMNEEARLVGEAIELIESQDPSSKEFSQNDSLAQVLGKEYPGRVHGLGIGTCLSRCFRNIPEQSDYGVQIEEYQMEIVKLKAEAAELKAAAAEEKAKRQRMETEAAEGKAKIQTMRNLLTYVIQQQGSNLPSEIAADLDSLRSAPTSSHAR